MEWLRCNKCYKLMEKLQRTFLITECTHIYCDICISEAAPKCNVCGRCNVRTMKLTRPPKFETVLNYFSPATDFAQQIKKATEFHDEQLTISMRACEEIEKKYEYGKRKYAELRKEIEMQYSGYNEMLEKEKKLEEAIRAYEKKFMEKSNVPINMDMDVCETSQNHERFGDRREDRSCSVHSRHSSSGQISTRGSQNKDKRMQSSMQPNLNHKLRSASSKASCTPTGSNYVPHSRCEIMASGDRPGVKRDGDFVVPTIQHVPKSVASIRKKVRILPRLSAPKTGYDF